MIYTIRFSASVCYIINEYLTYFTLKNKHILQFILAKSRSQTTVAMSQGPVPFLYCDLYMRAHSEKT